MSFPQVASLSLQFILSQTQSPSSIPQLDPVDQISEGFGIQEIKSVYSKILSKSDSLPNRQHKDALDNYLKVSAQKLYGHLQQLKRLGKTPEFIRETGINSLKEIKSCSLQMIADFEAFHTGSARLETAYTQFEASVAASANAFTPLTYSAAGQNPGLNALFANAIDQYQLTPATGQPFALEAVVARVHSLANRTPAGDVAKISPLGPIERRELLEKFEAMEGAATLSSLADIVTFVPEQTVNLGIFGAKKTCELPPMQETCQTVVDFSHKSVKFIGTLVPERIKTSVKVVVVNREALIAREIIENSKLGIPQELTERYHSDLIHGSFFMVPLAGTSVVKMMPKNLWSMTKDVLKKAPITSVGQNVKTVVETVKSSPASSAGEDYFKNRIIKGSTNMVPEDLGLSSELFKSLHLHEIPKLDGTKFNLMGRMIKRKDVFEIYVDVLEVPLGRLQNALTVLHHFKQIAKANQAKVLHLEANIVNPKLLQVLRKRFGEPEYVGKRVYNYIYKVPSFTIPLE
jgi:hypothetical protein